MAMTIATAFALSGAARPSLQRTATIQKCANTALFRPTIPHIAPHRARTLAAASAGPGKETSTTARETPPSPSTSGSYKISLLYDGDCKLCMKEVAFLRRRVEKQGPPPAIKFVDIAASSYNPADNAGIDYETAMNRIHGITSEGKVIVGVPVFREAYAAVGLGWVYAATKIPMVGAAAEAVYNVWAKMRLKLTGRPPLEDVMQLRRDRAEANCRDVSDNM